MFKIGRAYKLTEQYDKLRAHMEQFQAGNARNPRVAEAIYWIGWTYKQAGEPEKAREVYWKAITDYGNDPTIRSVDELFPAVAKLYKGEEEQTQYYARLRDLREEADTSGKKTLAMRALWAQAAALRKKDPAQSQAILVDASSRVNVQSTNPLLLADFADALLAAGKEKEGEQMFRDLVKWNPRAPQKDRSLATLGQIEAKRGNEKAALAQYDRFERETMGSRLFGQVMLAKAELLTTRGQSAEARAALEKLLAYEYSSGQDKAKALFLIGEGYMKEGKPDKAIPYFQRIYVMHGRWRDWVAKAYLRSGEAFEKLKDEPSARRTYQELTESEDLSQFKETEQAGQRLKALGGPLPKENAQG
jgi:tetratricopeptide (TPR) repeat protein